MSETFTFAGVDGKGGSNGCCLVPRSGITFIRSADHQAGTCLHTLPAAPPSEGKMHVPTCGTNVIYLNAYLNHSTKPNMRTREGYTFTTCRMIRRGEELTVDYRTYGAEAALKGAVGAKLRSNGERQTRVGIGRLTRASLLPILRTHCKASR